MTETAAPPRKGILRDYFETIVVCVIFVIFSRGFVFQQSKIPTGSMLNTLLVGDYIMVNRFAYAPTATALEKALLPVRDVQRGDVIVFKFPEDPDTDFIKRVIGLPGDRIETRGVQTFVNGKLVDEPYLTIADRLGNPIDRTRYVDAFPPYVVPENCYFVMGDHRNDSRDSRFWGCVSKDLIRGRAFLVWYSYPERPDDYLLTGAAWRAAFREKLFHFFDRSRWKRCFTIIR